MTLVDEMISADRRTGAAASGIQEHGMNFETEWRRVGGARIISLSGKLHLGHATSRLREAIRIELRRGTKRLLLDLSRVSSIDSAGIGELVGAQTAAQRSGATLKIVSLPTRIESMLRLARILTVFDVWPDEASAINSFARHP